MKTQTPFGLSDFLPDEAELNVTILEKIAKVFKAFKYQKIRTPSLEYFDTLSRGMGKNLIEQSIRFMDNIGKVVVLRPDHTTPIARLVATRLQTSKLPLRLSYFNSIFRHQVRVKHQGVEFFQAGIELIGENTPAADAEVIMVCIDTMKKLGLKNFKIDIGHTDFIKGFKESEKQALLNGDYIKLRRIPDRGGVSLVKDYPGLVKLYSILKKKGYAEYVSFNKGLVKDIEYYTGMIFTCNVQGIRKAVGSGGRYDNLIAKFGYECPAVGFALNVSVIQDAFQNMVKKTMRPLDDMLTIAGAKGYLMDKAVELLAQIGIEFPDNLSTSRKLFTEDKKNGVRLLQIRPWDVSVFVEQGAADLGIVGQDVLNEKEDQVLKLLDLDYGKCDLVLAGLKKVKPEDLPHNVRVASKFTNSTQKYFAALGKKVQIIKMYGAVELAPLTGLSDIICDLTATGKTLKENKLYILDTVFESSAVLVANPISLKFHYDRVIDLVNQLKKVV